MAFYKSFVRSSHRSENARHRLREETDFVPVSECGADGARGQSLRLHAGRRGGRRQSDNEQRKHHHIPVRSHFTGTTDRQGQRERRRFRNDSRLLNTQTVCNSFSLK